MSTTVEERPGQPVELENDPLIEIQNRIFIFHYKARYRPVEDLIWGMDLLDAKQRAIAYCNMNNITFISVRPAFLNLNLRPRTEVGLQPQLSSGPPNAA